jgi:hypothetical protein
MPLKHLALGAFGGIQHFLQMFSSCWLLVLEIRGSSVESTAFFIKNNAKPVAKGITRAAITLVQGCLAAVASFTSAVAISSHDGAR